MSSWRDGIWSFRVPADVINAIGKGETRPLVRTVDGVKEPQNRRADLVFN